MGRTWWGKLNICCSNKTSQSNIKSCDRYVLETPTSKTNPTQPSMFQRVKMWRRLVTRIPAPLVRVPPMRPLSLSSLTGKGNDEKVVNNNIIQILKLVAIQHWHQFSSDQLSSNMCCWKFLLLAFLVNTCLKVMDQSALSRKVDPQEAAMKKAADEMAR